MDRIDYIKGLPNKVQAFQAFLNKYSYFDGQVVYVQIAVPCRQEHQIFRDLYSDLKNLVDKTNDELCKNGFSSSIQMIYEKVSQQDLAVLYRKARVALITPLRDGMNLVALEYVASQSSQSPGVLILSEFAGAAKTMHEALKV